MSGASIVVDEMATLIRLEANEAGISNLTGLEGATNLIDLYLGANLASDLSPLAGLTNLTTLWLYDNNISDLSPLAGLTNLIGLHLRGNNISDLSPLAGLTNLTTLWLYDNNISDLSPLAGLTNLTTLYLSGNNISDLSPLVANAGLGGGDTINVKDNYLLSINHTSIKTHIPTLQSRGVTVEFDDRTHLNVGEPYTVRLIYFLPSDRQSKPDIDTKMDTLIKWVQQFYADDMKYHGFGRKTFRIETDATGKAVVHHVAGQFTAEYYERGAFGKVHGEIEEQFDTQKNIYLVVVDSGYLIGGAPGRATLGSGAGGVAVINNIRDLAYYVYLASHELRHTFGLSHNFSMDPRGFALGISKCTAELLDVHRYFNASRQGQDFLRNTTIEMLPPSLAPPPNTSRLRFEVTDPDGLHQAQLLTPEVSVAGGLTGGFIACKRFNGTSSTVEFVTTALTPKSDFVYLRIIDVHGNISWSNSYPIDVTSLLPPLQVVSIPDANLAAAVRETIGRSLTTHTMLHFIKLNAPNRQITDLTGLEQAHTLRTLSLGGEWVSGEGYVNSNAVSDISPLAGLTRLTGLWLDNTSISDVSALAGLTQLRTLNLGHNSISDVSVLAGLTQLNTLYLYNNSISDVSALAGLTQLNTLWLSYNAISDVSALSGLTQLRTLNLSNTSISDISALAGLTQLTYLHLDSNSISDVSALAGLTQLTYLNLGHNAISDVSALAGLTQLNTLYLEGNPLSYASIHTHIPAMQAKGIEVKFDNRTHRALLKISGDNQKGVSFAPLSNPFVVEAQDENGSALAGVSVTFAVVIGSGILSTISITTDKNGRAESTLMLGPNLETNTVQVSAARMQGSVSFQATSDHFPTEHLLSVPRGVSLIHVPLKVTTVDGVAQTITSVADLYDALGGADTVNLLITHDSTTQRWHSYLGDLSRGTVADPVLTDAKGIIAVMNNAVSLRLGGDALGTNGSSTLTLYPGLNFVGVPLRDSRVTRVSDLFTLEGGVSNITVLGNEGFRIVHRELRSKQTGSVGNILITGGRSFILEARAAATVIISGDAWYNISEMATVLPPTIAGIEVKDATPVLALRGSIVGEGAPVNKEDFHIVVKNLSTDREITTIIGDENLFPLDKVALNPDPIDGVEYQFTIVDTKAGRAAKIGDILEISVQSPESSIGAEPLQYTVTAEDVLRSRIQLAELVIYEIQWETELLANYPNPFTPETWIPYRLAEDALITLTIYDASGRVVRTLDVGHRIAAIYESRSKAIYWNGRNEFGETVASGVYFYHLSAGDYSATRKMAILK